MQYSIAALYCALRILSVAKAAPIEPSPCTATTSPSATPTPPTTLSGTNTQNSTISQASASAPAKSTSPPSGRTITCPPGTKGFKQFNPTLHSIGQETQDSPFFHLTNDTTAKTYFEQIISFTGIPSTASNLALGWGISTTAPEFSTKGAATAALFLLDGSKLDLKTTVVSKEVVDAAVDKSAGFEDGRVGGAGFGFWDTPDYPRPQDHRISSQPLPARESLLLRIGLIDEGEVKIRQTEKDGLYLQYDC